MYRWIGLFFLVIAFSCVSQGHRERAQACQKWVAATDKIRVLSTTRMIEDLVQQIGQEQVASLALITGELDPHSYQLVKGDQERMNTADLIFYNGLNLEHGPSLQYALQEAPHSYAVSENIVRQRPSLIIVHEGQVDPHIWMDISLWKEAVSEIVQALSSFDPENSQVYSQRGKRVKAHLQQAHEQVRASLQQIPDRKRYLVTSHDAFHYFARAYLATEQEREGLGWQERVAAPEGLAPESQLSSQDIRDIITYVSDKGLSVIFPESNVSQHSLKKIKEAAKEEGIDLVIAKELLYGDAMGPEGMSYIEMIQHNGDVIGKHLNGEA